MKHLISVILTVCIFGLTFSETEKRINKNPQIETNNSESEWLSDTDLRYSFIFLACGFGM